MEKIRWCLKAKNGIELVEPNDNLSKVYLKKSEDALKAAAALDGNKDWEISSSYYAMYFALYAILMKIGVKCEIHSCTIEFMDRFLSDYFDAEDRKLLKDSMRMRIDAQYYVDRNISEDESRKMISEAPQFMIQCREVLFRMRNDDIEDIRERIGDMQK